MMRPLKPEYSIFVILLLVFIVHLEKGGGDASFRYLDSTHAIVDEGRFEIDTYKDNTGDLAFYGGHYYPSAPPGLSFLAIVPYLPFNFFYKLVLPILNNTDSYAELNSKIKLNYIEKGLNPNSQFLNIDLVHFFVSNVFIQIFTSFIVSSLLGILIYKTLNIIYKDKKINFIVTLFSVFGTIIFSYTIAFHAHVPSTFFLFLSFYLLLKMKKTKENRIGTFLYSGMSAGVSITMNYTLVPLLGFLYIYFIKNLKSFTKRNLLIYCAGTLVPIALLMAYFWIVFGSPFVTPHDFPSDTIMSTHSKGFYGFSYPSIHHIFMLLFSPYRGFFFYMPFFISPQP